MQVKETWSQPFKLEDYLGQTPILSFYKYSFVVTPDRNLDGYGKVTWCLTRL